jgi:hypothetical protein
VTALRTKTEEKKVPKKTPLEHARDEIMQTINDLRSTLPGLQASVLLTAPDGKGSADATFFSTHDAERAAKIMLDIIKVGTPKEFKGPQIPEAS